MATKEITSADIKQAGVVMNELATLANEVDRGCYFIHGQLVGADVEAERISCELNRLRSAICTMGWLADIASGKIGGSIAKGGAEEWLLPPSYHSATEVAHG